jgi:hypothetical protein
MRVAPCLFPDPSVSQEGEDFDWPLPYSVESPCPPKSILDVHRDKTAKPDSEDIEESLDKPNITIPAKVEKFIPAVGNEPEKAQITVEGADELYREVRIENASRDADGNPVSLKKGAEVELTIEVDPKDAKPKE